METLFAGPFPSVRKDWSVVLSFVIQEEIMKCFESKFQNNVSHIFASIVLSISFKYFCRWEWQLTFKVGFNGSFFITRAVSIKMLAITTSFFERLAIPNKFFNFEGPFWRTFFILISIFIKLLDMLIWT